MLSRGINAANFTPATVGLYAPALHHGPVGEGSAKDIKGRADGEIHPAFAQAVYGFQVLHAAETAELVVVPVHAGKIPGPGNGQLVQNF